MNSAIVSGSSRGLGRELCRGLLFREIPVLGVSRSIPNEGMFTHNRYSHVAADLGTEPESRLRESIAHWLAGVAPAKVWLFMNAACIEPIGMASTINFDQWRSCVSVNIFGHFMLVQVLLSEQLKLGFDIHVINITSGAATKPVPGWSAYCVSKSAARMMLDVLSLEAGNSPKGSFQVSHVDPGVMDTEMQESIRQHSKSEFPWIDKFRQYHADAKLNTPEQVAKGILEEFLL